MGLDCGISLIIPSKIDGVNDLHMDVCYMRNFWKLSGAMNDCITEKHRAFSDVGEPNPYEISYTCKNRAYIAADLFNDMLREVNREIERIDLEILKGNKYPSSEWDTGIYIRRLNDVRLQIKMLIYWLRGKITLETLFDIVGEDELNWEEYDLNNIIVNFYYSY